MSNASTFKVVHQQAATTTSVWRNELRWQPTHQQPMIIASGRWVLTFFNFLFCCFSLSQRQYFSFTKKGNTFHEISLKCSFELLFFQLSFILFLSFFSDCIAYSWILLGFSVFQENIFLMVSLSKFQFVNLLRSLNQLCWCIFLGVLNPS